MRLSIVKFNEHVVVSEVLEDKQKPHVGWQNTSINVVYHNTTRSKADAFNVLLSQIVSTSPLQYPSIKVQT